MRQPENLAGKSFGRLAVIAYDHSNNGAFWRCKCSCGNECVVSAYSLKSGHTKSCGCYNHERVSQAAKKRKTKNKWEECGESAVVYFSNCDLSFICDVKDVEEILKHKWYLSKTGYPMTSDTASNTTLHRFLLDVPVGMVVDHINRNKLDNRRCNLRIVTQAINTKNIGVRKNSVSGVRGVTFCKRLNKWCARITKDKKTYNLGSFFDIKDAISIRKQYEKEFNFGG